MSIFPRKHGSVSSSRQAGFTIAEVLLSILILSVALLGVAAAISLGMTSAQHGSYVTQAETYAREMLEYLTNNNYPFNASTLLPVPSTSGINDPPGVNQPLAAPPLDVSGIVFPANTMFSRHITTISSIATTDPTATTGYKLDVRRISVTILWNENGKPRSVTLATFQRRPL
jgi:type II secretory pathway pseudopilin PulG